MAATELEEKRQACVKEIAEWYGKHRRIMSWRNLRPIARKYFPTDAELTDFYEWLVTPEGVSEMRKYLRLEAWMLGLGGPPHSSETGVYWWVRLGDVAEYEKFDTLDEAKEHVEETTGKPFSEAHWINRYGFELGGYGRRNYISFFEGDENAQPTERYLYGKIA